MLCGAQSNAIPVKISFESTMVVTTTTVHLLVASQFIKGGLGALPKHSMRLVQGGYIQVLI